MQPDLLLFRKETQALRFCQRARDCPVFEACDSIQYAVNVIRQWNKILYLHPPGRLISQHGGFISCLSCETHFKISLHILFPSS
jgi:hypothetical protein